MILIIKIILLFAFGIIIYEDLKTRMVHWVLFPILTFLLGYLYFIKSTPRFFITTVGMNMLLVSGIILLLYLYAKQIINQPFLNTSFGFGDFLFFYTICVAFPTVTFTILFVFSLLFSLVAHLILGNKKLKTTVPLAGYMALFYVLVFSVYFITGTPNLYLI